MRVELRVLLLLRAVGRERLLEVPLAVEKPHPDHRHAQVARRLQMVPGQDPQAARVLRQDLGQAELGRQVGDLAWCPGQAVVPGRAFQEALEPPPGRVQQAVDLGVGRRLCQAFPVQRVDDRERVAAGARPGLGVEPGEELARGRVPGGEEVSRQGREVEPEVGVPRHGPEPYG